jgi:hypothetical protein
MLIVVVGFVVRLVVMIVALQRLVVGWTKRRLAGWDQRT